MKKIKETLLSEDEGDSLAINKKGKRPLDGENKEGTKRLKTRGLFRQPTVNELNRLQETENLFNSNLFRLQIEEILQEVKLKEKTEKRFQQWFESLKNHLLSIATDDEEYDLTEATLIKKLKVKLPINDELKKTKCVFKFHKFSDVQIVGSYSLECPINSKLQINVQITVPSETFTKNDSVNYRYHKKRAAYLAYIASHLNKLELIDELTYSWQNGCETKPVIIIKPNGKLANHFTVSLNLVCESDTYKYHRLSPLRNNLRESWLLDEETNENNNEVGPPTPYYNHSILADLTATANHDYLKEMLINSENLKQAIVLLKIWLRQRNLEVSGHIASLFVGYLVQTKRINNIMSSYQIVRNVWISLKTSEWDIKGISLRKGSDSPTVTDFLPHFPVVFLDTTGSYNVCWQMTLGTYAALKHEANLAVNMLDNGKINSFIPLFMVPVDPLVQFDHVLKFKDFTCLKKTIISKAPKDKQVNYGVDQLSLAVETLHGLFSKGLGERAFLILPIVDASLSWPVNTSLKKAKQKYEEKLSFGLILNPEKALEGVLRGPPANLPEAEDFRSFWGPKSELRRFQDGAITEAVVWERQTATDARTLTKDILEYLLKLNYDVTPSTTYHLCDQLETLTLCKEFNTRVEESSLVVMRALDELKRDLRGLTQMPLDIGSVHGVSPVFSYADPLPPPPRPSPRGGWLRGVSALVKDNGSSLPPYVPACRVVVELGHSGKWPGDLQAFRALKAAFNLQIAERITKQLSIPAQPYPNHIDVFKNGIVIRLEIAHPKEITLLRRETENGVVKYRESEESVNLQRDTVILPKLRGALHGLHHKHSALGPTTVIFKRWLSAHLLSDPHFPSTLAELLVAAIFLHPEPLEPPMSPTIGFFRTLKLLAEKDWTKEVLVLDFNDDLTREELHNLESTLSALEPQPSIRLATAYDGSLPSVWSMTSPSGRVTSRAQAVARASLAVIRKAIEENKDNILAAFIPSKADYDVIIRLLPCAIQYAREHLTAPLVEQPGEPLAEHTAGGEVIPVVEFDPVHRYLEELRSAYSEFALFFHDRYGGDAIYVLWKPDIYDYKEFQVANAHALKQVEVDGEMKYKVNIPALIEDFQLLGEGIIEDIPGYVQCDDDFE